MTTLICALGFLFGIQFGSFATMASYRIPRGDDIVFTPSHCPKCNHRLTILDLFPIFSWIFFRGKCRHCKAPISPRYPLIELGVGLYATVLTYNTLLLAPIGNFVELAVRGAIALYVLIAFIMLAEGRRVPPLYYVAYHVVAAVFILRATENYYATALYAVGVVGMFYVASRLGKRFPALRLYAGVAAAAPICALVLYLQGTHSAAILLPVVAAGATFFNRALIRPAEITLTAFLLLAAIFFPMQANVGIILPIARVSPITFIG